MRPPLLHPLFYILLFCIFLLYILLFSVLCVLYILLGIKAPAKFCPYRESSDFVLNSIYSSVLIRDLLVYILCLNGSDLRGNSVWARVGRLCPPMPARSS
jgi:hypothetical protein